MGKNNFDETSLHKKAIRLLEGGIVECSGHAVRAINVHGDVNPCMLCDMDSACDYEMFDLCAECDGITHTMHILKFAHT